MRKSGGGEEGGRGGGRGDFLTGTTVPAFRTFFTTFQTTRDLLFVGARGRGGGATLGAGNGEGDGQGKGEGHGEGEGKGEGEGGREPRACAVASVPSPLRTRKPSRRLTSGTPAAFPLPSHGGHTGGAPADVRLHSPACSPLDPASAMAPGSASPQAGNLPAASALGVGIPRAPGAGATRRVPVGSSLPLVSPGGWVPSEAAGLRALAP